MLGISRSAPLYCWNCITTKILFSIALLVVFVQAHLCKLLRYYTEHDSRIAAFFVCGLLWRQRVQSRHAHKEKKATLLVAQNPASNWQFSSTDLFVEEYLYFALVIYPFAQSWWCYGKRDLGRAGVPAAFVDLVCTCWTFGKVPIRFHTSQSCSACG